MKNTPELRLLHQYGLRGNYQFPNASATIEGTEKGMMGWVVNRVASKDKIYGVVRYLVDNDRIAWVESESFGLDVESAKEWVTETFKDIRGRLLDRKAIKEVTDFVYRRHDELTRSNAMGFSEDDRDRLLTIEGGYLAYHVVDVHITEKQIEDDIPTWYIASTMKFSVERGEPIESDEEVYRAYKDESGKWFIEWYAS